MTIAGSDGLAAVSMRRVAAELGTSPMALYRYVGAKEELVDLMVDAAAGPAPDPAPGAGWRLGLRRRAFAQRAVLQRHPWVVRVPIAKPPITPNQIAWLEVGLGCLHGTGLAPGAKPTSGGSRRSPPT